MSETAVPGVRFPWSRKGRLSRLIPTRRDVTDVYAAKQTQPANYDAAVTALYEQASNKAQATLVWYQHARKRKSLWARGIQFVAIPSFALTGLLAAIQTMGPPTLAQISLAGLNAGQIGVLMAGIGAGVLSLDRLLGISSGWIRYMLTELDVQQAIDQFEFDWAVAYQSSPRDAAGKLSDGANLLLTLRTFTDKVNGLVESETKQWAVEFQQNMAFLQDWAKTKSQNLQSGMVSVSVNRGAGVDTHVIAFVDGQQWASGDGASIILPGVALGPHQISVAGKRNGADIKSDMAVTVAANAVTPLTVSLG